MSQLPAGKTEIIELMPQGEWKTGKELLGIIPEDVYVVIDHRPDNKEIYKSGWSGVDRYSISDIGLRKFMLAGGIKTIDQTTYKESQLVWISEFNGEYILPNGQPIPLPGHYEFDATVGGPRWLVRKQAEIARLVTQVEKKKREVKNLYLSEVEIFLAWRELAEEQQQDFTEIAEYVATNFINQAAQFGRQRAQTGAMDRALRRYFLIRDYTLKELQISAFHLVRTTVNYELMKVGLGVIETKLLQTASLMLDRGLPEGIVGDVIKLLAEGEMKKQDAAAPSGFFDADEDTIEGTVVEPENPEEAKLYNIPAEKETVGKAMQAMIKYNGWKIWNPRGANAKCEGFFDKGFNDLSEGEMLLLVRAYEKLLESKKAGASAAERNEQGAHLAEAMKRCIVQKRLWREPEEEATQLELPGTKAEEEPENEPDPEPTPDTGAE